MWNEQTNLEYVLGGVKGMGYGFKSRTEIAHKYKRGNNEEKAGQCYQVFRLVREQGFGHTKHEILRHDTGHWGDVV